MFTIETKVGRLVEAAMRSPVTRAEIDTADRTLREIARAHRRLVVVIADFRYARFLLQEDATHLIEVFRGHNKDIERSAILVSVASAVGVLQMERLIREANSPARRAFRDAREATGWLDEVLAAPERARLRAVLSENSP